MQLNFVGQNMTVSPALKTFTADKFKALQKRFTPITQINVHFKIEHLTHMAEATLHFEGAEIHAHAQGKDMYSAINSLVDKLTSQMAKHKEKRANEQRL